ncbi:unnamed protein product [Euphydryas editha]|uniref:Uncharacterized protein n=1 Tax=Euphydryas editha TaxID=104508 RepID=A0AAU9TMY6_EUPED|nr:unnamed protein product [Euphydryas editha]
MESIKQTLDDLTQVFNTKMNEFQKELKVEFLTPMNCSLICRHKLGCPNKDKPRVILIKFRDLTLRNQVWSSKINFKGSDVTISEFLTKKRHKIVLAAHQRFGVTKCWTRNGVIIVLGDDGSKHRVSAMSELNLIPGSISSDIEASNVSPNVEVVNPSKVITRMKRTMKK